MVKIVGMMENIILNGDNLRKSESYYHDNDVESILLSSLIK